MPTDFGWNCEAPDFFTASTSDANGQANVHLVAEALSDGEWDWAVWLCDSTSRTLQGITVDQVSAMKAAELGAQTILLTHVVHAA